MRTPRIVPPVYLLACVIAMLVLHRFFPIRQIISGPYRWLGLLPALLGVAIGLAAVRVFRKQKTTLVPGRVSDALVIQGPFKFTRNPMYLGMTLVLAAVAIGLGSITPWLLLPVFVMVISINIVPTEEAMLTEAFGETYKEYQRRVRRWV